MNAGKETTITVGSKSFKIGVFGLDNWLDLCAWLRNRPKTADPLERISRLPLERLPAETVDKLTREAIEEDKKLHTFTPGSEAAMREMMTPEGLIYTVKCLTGRTESEVKDLLLELAKEDRMGELSTAIFDSIGGVPEKNA